MARERTSIAILAKAPVPGRAKTRLISELGAHGAAYLHQCLVEQTVAIACASGVGPVTLWVTPTPSHRFFIDLAAAYPLALERQPDGDLGARMLAPIETAGGPTLVIGTDCPLLSGDHLREAAAALDTHEAALIPVEDGGYVLIGMRAPHAELFREMTWGVDTVLRETRHRLAAAGLSWRELDMLWDVDTPADLERLEELPQWKAMLAGSIS